MRDKCEVDGDFNDLQIVLDRDVESGLGITLDHLGEPPYHRMWVDEVIPNSNADLFGKLLPGDLITHVNGIDVSNTDFVSCVGPDMMGGPTVGMTVRRHGQGDEILQLMKSESTSQGTAMLKVRGPAMSLYDVSLYMTVHNDDLFHSDGSVSQ